MDKATFDRGLEIRKAVLGAEFVENSFKSADSFNRLCVPKIRFCNNGGEGRRG
jgi:hypothetical protein